MNPIITDRKSKLNQMIRMQREFLSDFIIKDDTDARIKPTTEKIRELEATREQLDAEFKAIQVQIVALTAKYTGLKL